MSLLSSDNFLQRACALFALVLAAGCSSAGETENDRDVSSDSAADVSYDARADSADGDEQSEAVFPRLAQLLEDLRELDRREARDLRVEEFQRDVAYSDEGFPLRDLRDDQPRITFVFFDAAHSGRSVSVAGDFNGWQPRDMAQPVAGVPLYVHETDAPADSTALKYKFVHDADTAEPTWFADPNARRYGHDNFGEFSLIGARTTQSHLERWPDFDRSAGQLAERGLRVYVPPGYRSEDASYRLLLMHDGQNLFAPDAIGGGWKVDETADSAILDDEMDAFVVVGIENSAARMEEYTHVTDTLGGEQVGGRADEYARFVVEGVLPFVRERYSLSSSPGDTAILGSSLGGLVSLYIAQRHPNVFGYAGSMSGTLAWGTFGQSNPTILGLYADSPPTELDIYLDSGGDPGIDCDGLHPVQSGVAHDNFCSNVAMREQLVSDGWARGEDLLYRWDEGARHNEAAWASRFERLIRDWFPAQ